MAQFDLQELLEERATLLAEIVSARGMCAREATMARIWYFFMMIASASLAAATGIIGAALGNSDIEKWAKIFLGFATALMTAITSQIPFKQDWVRNARARDRIDSLYRRYRGLTAGCKEAAFLRKAHEDARTALDQAIEAEKEEWQRQLALLERAAAEPVRTLEQLPDALAAAGAETATGKAGEAERDRPR
jgi:hypothetical protein